MKEVLDDQARRDLISYRLLRSRESLAEADYNAKGGYYNSAVNRLYYACYYVASALMLSARLDATTHKGIQRQLGLHFIMKGKLDPYYGSIYTRLFNARQAGDYEDFVFCDLRMFNELRPLAETFVENVRPLIAAD